MRKKALISSNQRIDQPDIRNLINFTDEEFDLLVKSLVSDQKGLIIRGFDMNVSSGLLLEATQEDLVCITPVGKLGFYSIAEDQLNIAMADNSVNYVEAQIYTEGTDNEVKAFWDPNVGVSGEEFTQNTNTVTKQLIRLVVNQIGFSGDSDKVAVATVVTNAGVVERIHDNYKNQVLSGSPSNPVFPQNSLFSLNDVNSDGVQDSYNFGSPRTDVNINDLEDFKAAILTQIRDILGDGRTTGEGSQNDWVIERPTNLYASNQDRNIQLIKGGNISFDAGLNQVSFDADFEISIPSIAGKNVIQTSTQSPITILNGEAAYVSIDRDANITENLTITVSLSNAVPQDKDVFVVCRRENNVVYFPDGTKLGDGESSELGYIIQTPSTTTDNAVVKWDGVEGKVIQNSNVTIDDSGNTIIPGNLTIQGSGVHSVSEQFANEVIEEYSRSTGTTVGVRGVAISGSSATHSVTTVNSFQDVTNLSINITTTGRPVVVVLVPFDSSPNAQIQVLNNQVSNINNTISFLRIARNGTGIADIEIGRQIIMDTATINSCLDSIFVGGTLVVDTVGPGTYNYKLQATKFSASQDMIVSNMKLVAYEL